jgi:glycosyltransferase involved in cell wall biosynthesis
MCVSVVIPTYNSGSLVVEAVSSVLAQTTHVAEVIVVDDGSTDDTADRLAPFGSSVRYIKKENGGVSSARNCGLAEATSQWIAFLDADDVWHPRKLELQMAVLARRPELALLGTRMYNWPTDSHPALDPSLSRDPIVLTFEDLVVGNQLGTSTIVARADVLRGVGEFDHSLQGPEDFDMWLRVARQSPVGRLLLPLAGYRTATPNSLSKNAVRMEAGLHAILAKLESHGSFYGRPLLRRKARAYVHHTCGLMYRDSGKSGTAANRFIRSLLEWPFRLRIGPEGRGKHMDRLLILAVTVRNLLTRVFTASGT